MKCCPQKIGQKQYENLVSMVSLMLKLFKPLFDIGNYVVLYSSFFIAKGINKIETKHLHAGYFINNQFYWPKEFPRDRLQPHFQNK